MAKINDFLKEHAISIARNPCVSPDFCLDWPALARRLAAGDVGLTVHEQSRFPTALGAFVLLEDARGEHAWLLESEAPSALQALSDGIELAPGRFAFPASWVNLLRIKNLVQEHDAESTIFPS